MNKITDIKAEQIYDSRNNPTLKVLVFVGEIYGIFEVPSGASTGKYEAYELRDGEDNKSGVSKAIGKIENIIKPALLGIEITEQEKIDQIMIDLDNTEHKTNLGGNSMIGVSIACAKTAAKIKNLETFQYLNSLEKIKESREKPLIFFNLINGGKHTKTDLAFQEYHIVPQTNDISLSVKICSEIQKELDKIIKEKFDYIPEKGDEGGIALPIKNVTIPFDLLKEAIDNLNYTDKVMLSIDAAASSFYDKEKKLYKFMDRGWTTDQMIGLYKKIVTDYPLIAIEDPLDEEDFDGFAKLQSAIPKINIIGDDLTVTNIKRLQIAIDKKSIKTILIKPNQIGTLTETIKTMKLARDNNLDCLISHRSGETMDTFIADLVYAFKSYGIKSGALGPKERDIKYNRLIDITK